MLPRCLSVGKCLILESVGMLQNKCPSQTVRPSRIGGSDGIVICIRDLLRAKRRANRTKRYTNSLRRYLLQFSRADGDRRRQSISSFTHNEIEAWLGKYPSAYTRQTWLNRLSTLFAFAVRRGLITANPCDRVERVTVDKKAPVILSPRQIKQLLIFCPSVMRPYLVLGLYAGIRPEEIQRLDWSQINLDAGTVLVQGKTRRRRLVTLEPVAVAELRKHPLQTGRVTPSNSTIRRWRVKACKAVGFDRWPQDVLRHTAASYMLALHKDAGKVAMQLGNSVKILLSHYHEPVSQADSDFFWQVGSYQVIPTPTV